MDAKVSFSFAYRVAVPFLWFTKSGTPIVARTSWRGLEIQFVFGGIGTLCRSLDVVWVVCSYTKVVSFKTTLPRQRCCIWILDFDGNMVGFQEYKHGLVKR